MPGLVEKLRRSRFPALATCVALVLALGSACRDTIQEPGGDSPASVAVSATVAASHAGDAGLVAAFETVDSLEVRLTRADDGSVIAERTVPFDASGDDVTEVTLEVELEEDRVEARLALSLLTGTEALFTDEASVTLEEAEVATVEVALEPVARTLELRDEPLSFTSLADSVVLHATMLFATGDTIGGVEPDWSSDDPSVVEVLADGTVVSRGSGQTLVRATHTGASDSVSAAVSAGISWQRVSAGGVHTCGLATDGTVYCWGWNGGGQLGDGTTTDRRTPVQVVGGITFAQISAANAHTCGVADDGTAWCWGDGSHGQFGDGTQEVSSTPVQVSGGISWQQVSTGALHTCGVATDGTAYCWGSNGIGQVGNGTSDTLFTSPQQVSGGISFEKISAGDYHTCGLTADGTAYCWGDNFDGQLGVGTTGNFHTTPVQVVDVSNFSQVVAGERTTCGVTGDGVAYCWGENTSGELGDGTTAARSTPVQVSGGLAFEQVTSGLDQSCGVTTGSAAYCWGSNSFGQLGVGDTTDRTVPTEVSGGISFRQVNNDAEYSVFHTCGVATDGTAYCWGRNDLGQLGVGDTTDRLTPVEVAHP